MGISLAEYKRKKAERDYHRHKGKRDVLMSTEVGRNVGHSHYCAYKLGCTDEHILEAKAMLGTLNEEEKVEWEKILERRAKGYCTEDEYGENEE